MSMLSKINFFLETERESLITWKRISRKDNFPDFNIFSIPLSINYTSKVVSFQQKSSKSERFTGQIEIISSTYLDQIKPKGRMAGRSSDPDLSMY